MASTYSTSLKLELMGTGDQTGTWGVTNNTNLGTLLEQAITGVLSVAQGDVANLTLTSLDGASDQARNAVVNLTGAMTANRNVIVPTANKVYLVKNSTTGGFAVTVKTAAGSGVAIANGTAQWVYCDGTNVVQGLSGTLAAQAASAVAITGGTITGLTSLGASGVALTSGTISGLTTLGASAAAITGGTISGLTTLGASAAAITGGTVTGLTSLTLASGAATPATNDAAALGTSSLMWSDLFLASGSVVNWNNGNVTLTHAAGQLTLAGGGLVLAAGTTSLAPLKLQSGTNLTTAVAGAVEYDGKAIYATTVASSRQVVTAQQFVIAAAAVALSNSSTSAQNVFDAANDTLTLAASTTYFFDAHITLTTGTTTHTTSFGLGGTATFTSLRYSSIVSATASGSAFNTNGYFASFSTAAATVLNSTTAQPLLTIKLSGVLRVNGGGTIIPQITFSAGPGSTCQTETNSYFRCWPVGSDTVAAVGNWA